MSFCPRQPPAGAQVPQGLAAPAEGGQSPRGVVLECVPPLPLHRALPPPWSSPWSSVGTLGFTRVPQVLQSVPGLSFS